MTKSLIPRLCVNCRQAFTGAVGYRCPACRTTARRGADRVTREYNTTRWERFRAFILARRPLCQRLRRGARCWAAATVVHHLVSPRQHPDLFYEPRNVVALCARCHPNTPGTPGWKVGRDYVDACEPGERGEADGWL